MSIGQSAEGDAETGSVQSTMKLTRHNTRLKPLPTITASSTILKALCTHAMNFKLAAAGVTLSEFRSGAFEAVVHRYGATRRQSQSNMSILLPSVITRPVFHFCWSDNYCIQHTLEALPPSTTRQPRLYQDFCISSADKRAVFYRIRNLIDPHLWPLAMITNAQSTSLISLWCW